MRVVQPITESQQKEVVAETLRYIRCAAELFNCQLEALPVVFDLKGRAAGMYKVRHGDGGTTQKIIRYNPYIFSKYFAENFSSTIPHEVAHYVTHSLYGFKGVRSHGAEWRDAMIQFGAEPDRTANFNLEGIPVRQHRKYNYTCGCRSHQLTSRRHFKILRDRARYLCRYCGGNLQPVAV